VQLCAFQFRFHLFFAVLSSLFFPIAELGLVLFNGKHLSPDNFPEEGKNVGHIF